MNHHRAGLCGLVAAYLLLTAACSAFHSAPAPPSTPMPPPTGALTALPALPTGPPLRQAANNVTLSTDGKDFAICSLNTQILGVTLQLQPGPGTYSYSIYEFDVGGYDVTELRIDVNFADPSKAWYVFGDYTRGSWSFVRADATSASDIDFPSGLLRSPYGRCYWGVLAWDGAYATINYIHTVTPHGEWASHLIDVSSPSYEVSTAHLAAALIAGRAYVAYVKHDPHAPDYDLRLAQCSAPEPEGAAGWTNSLVDGGAQYSAVDLAEINGLPAVLWTRYSDGALWYARATTLTPTGPSDWVYNSLPVVDYQDLISLAEVDGKPAVVYATQNASLWTEVHYLYSTLSKPLSALDWVDTVSLLTTGGNLDSLTLAAINGKPAMAFNDRDSPAFYCLLADSTTPANPAGWTMSVVQSYGAHVNGNFPRIELAEVDGRPAALYQCRELGLRYALADRPVPTSSEHWLNMQLNWNVLNCASLALTGEGLLGCYLENDDGDLLAVLANTPQPALYRDWRRSTVDGSGSFAVPRGAALASVGGTPLVIYIDEPSYELRCARYLGQ